MKNEFLDIEKDNAPLKDRLLKKVRIIFGEIPKHYEFLGNIDSNELDIFLKEIFKILKQKNISKEYFTFLRLYIANKKGFDYCIDFNTKLLKNIGYDNTVIEKSKSDIKYFPLTDKEILLAQKSIKAIFDSKNFTDADIKMLKEIGFSDKEIFTSINHGAYLLKNAPIIAAYLKK